MSLRASHQIEDLERLGPDLFLAAFPDQPVAAGLRVRRMPSRGWHRIALVEDARDPERRILLKALEAGHSLDPGAERHRRMLATEYRLLREVAPRISDTDPAIGCPRVFAYRPGAGVLALEVVDGPMLSTILFGLRPRREARSARRLLERCGEWLARFHALTRTSEEGNPFEWLLQEFEQPGAMHVFRRHGDMGLHADVRDVAARLLEAHRDLRVPRCTVHGVFAPYHVLVRGESIRVIDLESAHVNYPYLDLALFDAYAAFRPPWARALASARLALPAQRHALVLGYERHAGPLSAAERTVLGLARVHALVRFALEWERLAGSYWPKRVLRYAWWRRCLRRVWAEQMPPLRLAAGQAPSPGVR
ncbi:MAG TPA: hypothetical protein VGT40_06485 [Methylomirabilota bacterium]|nr:hypothetical protein [Methylomirabilota bacterium]